MIVSIPVDKGTYPVTPVGSPLNPQSITSVVAAPDAAVDAADAQVPDAIALYPSAVVPVVIVEVIPPGLLNWTARAAATADPRVTPAPVLIVVEPEGKTNVLPAALPVSVTAPVCTVRAVLNVAETPAAAVSELVPFPSLVTLGVESSIVAVDHSGAVAPEFCRQR